MSRHFTLDSIKTKLNALQNLKSYKKEEKVLEASLKREAIMSKIFVDKFNKAFLNYGLNIIISNNISKT